MTKIAKGKVKGRFVELEPGATFPDGATVTVRLSSKEPWLKHAGVWSDWTDLDELIEQIYSSRTIEVEGPHI